MESPEHPAYKALQSIGREITTKVRPRAVVVFSAHFADQPSTIEVNTASSMPLLYDYYGFPPRYYDIKYPNTGSPELAEKVLGLLADAGIKAEGVRRGLDHGVFAPFLVAFDPEGNPLGCPVVEVSLFDSDDGEVHVRLGEAMQSLRDEGVLIVVSGMAVHNLREMFRLPPPEIGKGTDYCASFDEALRGAVETKGVQERRKAMGGLLKRGDARKAHPSFEHLLPVFIGAGAAGEDEGRKIWGALEGSMSWAMFRFGEVAA